MQLSELCFTSLAPSERLEAWLLHATRGAIADVLTWPYTISNVSEVLEMQSTCKSLQAMTFNWLHTTPDCMASDASPTDRLRAALQIYEQICKERASPSVANQALVPFWIRKVAAARCELARHLAVSCEDILGSDLLYEQAASDIRELAIYSNCTLIKLNQAALRSWLADRLCLLVAAGLPWDQEYTWGLAMLDDVDHPDLQEPNAPLVIARLGDDCLHRLQTVAACADRALCHFTRTSAHVEYGRALCCAAFRLQMSPPKAAQAEQVRQAAPDMVSYPYVVLRPPF